MENGSQQVLTRLPPQGIVDSECLEAVRPVDRIQDSRDDGLAVAAMLLFM